jgi:hypothetical protein
LVTHRGAVSASLPAAGLFHRDHPAEDEGPEEAWRLARTAVDYGCAVFQIANAVRPERGIRDAVFAALLRRLLITAEASIAVLSRGLVEPALSLSRTLLDIELAFRLIHQDKTDTLAKRLAAFHYLTYQEHGEGMLKNAPTRTGVLQRRDRIQEVIAIAKSYARFLEQGVFDEVREAIRTDKNWHGFRNAEEAFRAIGQDYDYHMTYDGGTPFVHASNPDHDFVDSREGGLVLKAFVERDPQRIQVMLGHVVLRTIELIGIYVDEKGINVDERVGATATIQFDNGRKFDVDSLTALRTLAMREFDVRDEGFKKA